MIVEDIEEEEEEEEEAMAVMTMELVIVDLQGAHLIEVGLLVTTPLGGHLTVVVGQGENDRGLCPTLHMEALLIEATGVVQMGMPGNFGP